MCPDTYPVYLNAYPGVVVTHPSVSYSYHTCNHWFICMHEFLLRCVFFIRFGSSPTFPFLCRFGMDGKTCLMKTVCEISSSPLLFDGLVGELLNIALM